MNEIFKKYGKHVHYKKGTPIIKQGYNLDHIIYIVRGKAKALRFNEDGKEILLEIFTSDNILGDLELTLNRSVSETTIVAITDMDCYIMLMDISRRYFKKNIEFSNLIASNLANKLNNTSLQFSINNSLSVRERLIQYIESTCDDDIFDENLVELSGLLSVSYRHLNRTINNLCKEDILEIVPSSKSKKRYRFNRDNITKTV
jgi:CRP/FNR family putative post-exponential-phase nitrogen-starvation transcriptional regulator